MAETTNFIGQSYVIVLSRRSHKTRATNSVFRRPQAIPGWWWLFISYMSLIHIVCLALIHRARTNIDIPGGSMFRPRSVKHTAMSSIGFVKIWSLIFYIHISLTQISRKCIFDRNMFAIKMFSFNKLTLNYRLHGHCHFGTSIDLLQSQHGKIITSIIMCLTKLPTHT